MYDQLAQQSVMQGHTIAGHPAAGVPAGGLTTCRTHTCSTHSAGIFIKATHTHTHTCALLLLLYLGKVPEQEQANNIALVKYAGCGAWSYQASKYHPPPVHGPRCRAAWQQPPAAGLGPRPGCAARRPPARRVPPSSGAQESGATGQRARGLLAQCNHTQRACGRRQHTAVV